MKPPRGYAPLRRHRVTIPDAAYFITLCTRDRRTGLNTVPVAASLRAQFAALENDGALRLQAAVVMPDHLHLLFVVTATLTIGQIIGRLKAKTRPALSLSGLSWQGNFYEHRLRPDDSIEDVLHYLFLNPYRARLLAADKAYPYFWLGPVEAKWFNPTLDDHRPFPEWLA